MLEVEGGFEIAWRKAPWVVRGDYLKIKKYGFASTQFEEWAKASSRPVRMFLSTDYRNKTSTGRAAIIQPNAGLYEAFQHFANRGELITLHMNAVEQVDSRFYNIRDRLNVPYHWRVDDIISTLSTEHAGIGYHAGHEDGFIVQLAGKRLWNLWSEECTPARYRLENLRPKIGVNSALRHPRRDPDFTFSLERGDVLYIPPFWPHEGVTTAESLSVSIAWKGLAPISFVSADYVEEAYKLHPEKSVSLFEDISNWQLWKDAAIERIKNTWSSDMLVKTQAIENFIKEFNDFGPKYI